MNPGHLVDEGGSSPVVPDLRLATFRDSRGLPVTRWPKQVLPSATVIVVDKDTTPWRVVVHQRTDNLQFGLPGGRVEIGENIRETAIRECFEETGLHIKIERLTSIDSDPRNGAIVSYPDGNIIQYVNCSFLCSVISGILRKSEESIDVFWADVMHLPKPFMPIHRWRLEQVLESSVGISVM